MLYGVYDRDYGQAEILAAGGDIAPFIASGVASTAGTGGVASTAGTGGVAGAIGAIGTVGNVIKGVASPVVGLFKSIGSLFGGGKKYDMCVDFCTGVTVGKRGKSVSGPDCPAQYPNSMRADKFNDQAYRLEQISRGLVKPCSQSSQDFSLTNSPTGVIVVAGAGGLVLLGLGYAVGKIRRRRKR